MKIGICTLYFENNNYGANLQAYALCQICKKLGYEAEQICYYDSYRLKKIASRVYRIFLGKRYYKNNDFYIRKKAIEKFRNSIPHSSIYYRSTLKKANLYYDVFIVGSDQVWNPSWVNQALSLSFVDKGKLRISYAASLGRENLSDDEKFFFTSMLSKMDFISVREKNNTQLIASLTDKPVNWVLDPTLLLDRNDWDKVASKKMIFENYIFCYFLGEDESVRNVAVQYAKRHGLKIVTIPFLSYRYRKCDDGFGDYGLYDISPSEFITLIKNAKLVLTDSFHATVFSHIYCKEFVVFSPENNQSRVRMDSLTEMFETKDRHLVGELFSIENIEKLKPIDYSTNANLFLEAKENSIDYLRNSLSNSGAKNEYHM